MATSIQRLKNDKNAEKQFELTTKIAKLSDQSFVSNMQLNDILSELCSSDGNFDILGKDRQAAIFAITQLMELLRRLPMKFFREVDNRIHILEAMQAQLDELIVVEEQEENEELGNEVVDESEDEQPSAENIVKNA